MARYSYSKLNAYRTCRSSTGSSTSTRSPSRSLVGSEALMGSRVHDALTRLYKQVAVGCAPTPDEVPAVYALAGRPSVATTCAS